MKRLSLFGLCFAACCLIVCKIADAATFCVDPGGGGTHTNLQDALDDAGTNSQDDTIRIGEGIYSGNFVYMSTQGFSITIRGGYGPGCTAATDTPADTLLDGGGNGRVLLVESQNGGDVHVEGLSIQNGAQPPNGAGGGLCAVSHSIFGPSGNVLIKNTMVSQNTLSILGGGIYAISEHTGSAGDSGRVSLINNIVTGNTAGHGGGGVYASSYSKNGSAGAVRLINNTISGNRALDKGGGVYLYTWAGSGTAEDIEVYNNIVWDNEEEDLYISNSGYPADIFHNTYVHIDAANWNAVVLKGNDKLPPAFRATGSWNDSATPGDPSDDTWIRGDYHLQARSPCIGTGILEMKTRSPESGPYHAEIGPETDFEGDSRSDQWHAVSPSEAYKYCDRGADEYIANPVPLLMLLLLDG